MDIPVNHLNNRLALQLPAQLPLGLVFVQGGVANLAYDEEVKVVKGTSFPAVLDLVEEAYSIRCRLSARVVEETTLHDGDHIRAGGHLVFDAQHAVYELLARDVEIIGGEEASLPASPASVSSESALDAPVGRSALTPVLADIKKRSETASLAQGELPVWVQRMAPPEVQSEMGEQAENAPGGPAAPKQPVLDDDLVQFLSAAMENVEDVEITPDLLEEVGESETETAVPDPTMTHAYDIPPAPAATEPPRPRSARRQLDWPLILLMLSVVILAAALLLIFLTQTG